MGEMCKAESLTSGMTLSPTAAAPTLQAQASTRAEADVPSSFMVVSSAYDYYGVFSPEGRNYTGYPFSIEWPAEGESGEVTVTGLYDFGKYSGVQLIPVKGTYDAAENTLTIPTPFNSRFQEKCVKVGTYVRGDEVFTGVLAACTMGDTPDMSGQIPINVLDQLVFDVAPDGTLTPRTSWLIYSFGGSQNGIENLFNFSMVKPVSDDAQLIAVPAEVSFPDGEVYAGTKVVEPMNIVNLGRTATDIEYVFSDFQLQLAALPKVEPLSFNRMEVRLTAQEAGTYEGLVTLSYSGKSLEVPVKANVQPTIDFNAIVKSGEFHFSLPESDYITYSPWEITDELTGFPVAVASAGGQGYCGLRADVNIPKGQVGVISWKGISHTMMPNGVTVMLDGEKQVFNNVYAWNGYNDLHPANGHVIVPEGAHFLVFEYIDQMDWLSMGLVDEPQKAYIWDLNLQTAPATDNAGVLVDETVDFGTWYVDKFVHGAYSEATILNTGREDLEVTGGVNSNSFSVEPAGRFAPTMEELKALISFHGTEPGTYDETVTVKTNGGDFKVRCVANVEAIPNDYSFLTTEGDLSFGTSVAHPFSIDSEKGVAFSSTAKLENYNDADPDSWLSVGFEVPEGKTGTLSWTAFNSSNDYLQFGGDQTFTDGTRIFLDGEMIAEFVGICEASSLDVDEYFLTVNPGLHVLKFNYIRMSSSSNGNDDRFTLKDIGLSLRESGVTEVEDTEIIGTIYFDVNGHRVAAPEKGIFIKQTLLSNGDVKVTKVIR